MKTHRFLVEVQSNMTWTDTAAFVEDAVSSWGGQYFPGDYDSEPDPRSEIEERHIKVKRYVRPRRVVGTVLDFKGTINPTEGKAE